MNPDADLFPYRVTSGFRPLKGLHIGHYAAVVRDLCKVQYVFPQSCFIFIADHHGRSRWSIPEELEDIHNRGFDTLRQLIALGIDPKHAVLYRQSDIPELIEIMWLLSGGTRHSELLKNHALEGRDLTAGMYLYPMLMASDIISLRSTHVAVGGDQKQHIELARDIARRMNRHLGGKAKAQPIVPVPAPLNSAPSTIYGIEDDLGGRPRKMAFEIGNEIPIFAEDDIIIERVNQVMTRPVAWGQPLQVEDDHILYYLEVLDGQDEAAALRAEYETAAVGYREAKKRLLDFHMEKFKGARQLYEEISLSDIDRYVAEGALTVRGLIEPFIAELRYRLKYQ